MCDSVSGRFDMWTVHVYVLLIWPLFINAESNLLYDYSNGWIPVSSETVYDQIKREGLKIPHYIASQKIQLLHTDINKVHTPQVVLKSPGEDDQHNDDKFKYECEFKNYVNDCKEELSQKFIDESRHNFVTKIMLNNQNESEYEADRRSRKIADYGENNDFRDSFFVELPKTKVKNYEVTENDTEQDEIKTAHDDYNYEPPKNIESNALFEILSKYNINKGDVLPNYDLSRKPKAQVLLKQNMVVTSKPIHNQVVRYNNLNHLTVDPILAVFLSNYGFYLQGMYGRHNRYHNLYGYLASNNIHNNRPFGFYKIFSDTDSSH